MEGEYSTEQILSEISQDNGGESAEIQDSSGQDVSASQTAKSAKETTKPQLYKYTVNGREVEEPIETILKRASMGYHYAQRAEELNRQQEEIKKIREENQRLQRWRQYDEYATQNPQWNEHVQSMWEKRDQLLAEKQSQLDPNDPHFQHIQSLRDEITKKLDPLMQFVQTAQQEREQLRIAHEDQSLAGEIKSVREKFANVDFDQADDSGRSLEYRVTKHMVENRIPSFAAAFKDLYHDELLARAKEEAKEQYAKEHKEQAKKGLLGRSSTPKTKPEALSNGLLRKSSYDDLSELVKQELGLA